MARTTIDGEEVGGFRRNLDSTTANLASGATYTGGYKLLSDGAKSVLLNILIDAFCKVTIDWSEDGSTLRHSHILWVGGSNGLAHAFAVRARYVRMTIKNTGLKIDGTTGFTTVSLYAQIWEQSSEATTRTGYFLQILQNATLTTTTTMFFEELPHYSGGQVNALIYVGIIEVVGTVSGTSPTLQLGYAMSPDGTNLSQAETLTTSLTVTATRQFTTGGGIDVGTGKYLRMRYVLTGTSPSFGGTYVSVVEVFEP